MNKRKCVIFGAGNHGINYYLQNKDNVVAFVDNDKSKQGKYIFDTPVLSPKRLLELDYNVVLISAEKFAEQIKNQLIEMGVNERKISLELIEQLDYEKHRILNHRMILYTVLEGEEEHYREYEERWFQLKSKYREIQVFWFDMYSIGEMLTRFFEIYEKEPAETGIMKVFLPSFDYMDRICNSSVVNFLRNYIMIPNAKDIPFWYHVLSYHRNELNDQNVMRYWIRRDFDVYRSIPYQSKFVLPENEKIEEQKRKMGVEGDYICFAARTEKYNKNVDDEMSLRNTNFDDYKKAIDYIGEKGIKAVRIGQDAALQYGMPNLIDYAGQYYDKKMDMYLANGSKAFVTSGSGIYAFAMLFSIPLLVVNNIWMHTGFGGFRYTEHDLYIPQKYYNTRENRYLSLKEMFDVDKYTFGDTRRYAEIGIELQQNTPEEIKDALIELLERVDGTWRSTQEDEENEKRYDELYHEVLEMKFPSGPPHAWHLSSSYMRRNKYLIS